jgi:hypothetical protein
MKMEAALSSKFMVNCQPARHHISVYNEALKRNSKFTWEMPLYIHKENV